MSFFRSENQSFVATLQAGPEKSEVIRRKPRDPHYLNPVLIAKQYDIQPKPCSAFIQKPFLVLIIFARPDGFKLRQAIRKTWASLANPICGVRVLFMFGRVYDAVVADHAAPGGGKVRRHHPVQSV